MKSPPTLSSRFFQRTHTHVDSLKKIFSGGEKSSLLFQKAGRRKKNSTAPQFFPSLFSLVETFLHRRALANREEPERTYMCFSMAVLPCLFKTFKSLDGAGVFPWYIHAVVGRLNVDFFIFFSAATNLLSFECVGWFLKLAGSMLWLLVLWLVYMAFFGKIGFSDFFSKCLSPNVNSWESEEV